MIQIDFMKNRILFFLTLICVMGCDPGEKDPINDYDYFPLRLNAPLIYQVTETRYSAGNPEPTVTTWQEKDEAVRLTNAPDGAPLYVYSRSVRNQGGDSWQKVKEYTVTRYPDKYLLTEDNVTTIPLVFPIDEKTTWNRHAYNTREPEECKFEDLHQPRTIGSTTYEKTIHVQGRKFINDPIVRYNLGYFQYAKGVGLVFEEQTDYEYCQETHCYGQQQVISGVSKIRQLIQN